MNSKQAENSWTPFVSVNLMNSTSEDNVVLSKRVLTKEEDQEDGWFDKYEKKFQVVNILWSISFFLLWSASELELSFKCFAF